MFSEDGDTFQLSVPVEVIDHIVREDLKRSARIFKDNLRNGNYIYENNEDAEAALESVYFLLSKWYMNEETFSEFKKELDEEDNNASR